MLTTSEPMPPDSPIEGAYHRLRVEVEAKHTAQSFGREYPTVLATPILLGWMEVAAGRCLEGHLERGMTSLGYKVELTHRQAAWPGQIVEVQMRLTRRIQSLLLFEGQALVDDAPIAELRHQRKLLRLDDLQQGA